MITLSILIYFIVHLSFLGRCKRHAMIEDAKTAIMIIACMLCPILWIPCIIWNCVSLKNTVVKFVKDCKQELLKAKDYVKGLIN